MRFLKFFDFQKKRPDSDRLFSGKILIICTICKEWCVNRKLVINKQWLRYCVFKIRYVYKQSMCDDWTRSSINIAMKDYPEFKNGGYAKQGYYIVSSMTPRIDEGNGDCCWMNIDVQKLKQAALRDRQYVFDAYINGNRYIYSCPAKALNKIVPLFLTPLTRKDGTQEWKLYVDYKLGEVYSDVRFTQEPFFYLNKIHTPEECTALFEQANSMGTKAKDK